jgi:hypothetical protein
MKPRRLVLADGVWRFKVGRVVTTVWSPSGKKVPLMNWWVSGPGAVGAHVCGDPKCSSGGKPVTPGNLRAFIEGNVDYFSASKTDVQFFF